MWAILLNNTPINETNELKSLGLTITNNLSWNNHIISLIKKASKRLFILKKYINILPQPAFIKIYTGMILPILEYEMLFMIQHHSPLASPLKIFNAKPQ